MKYLLLSVFFLFAKCSDVVTNALSDIDVDKMLTEVVSSSLEEVDAAKKTKNKKTSDDKDEKVLMPAKLKNKEEIILHRDCYVCSFSPEMLAPHYVAWVLTAERTEGDVKREESFYPDDSLPEEMRVKPSDYSRSGYDRGHMCPAADNRHSSKAMKESFYMSNICPQNHDLNSNEWNDLEMACRRLAKKYGKIYVVSGPIYGEKIKKIGNRKKYKIAVPESFFKVILVPGENPDGVGFIMPNKSVNKSYKEFATSIDEVEQATGFDFFPALPDKVEKEVEKHNVMLR